MNLIILFVLVLLIQLKFDFSKIPPYITLRAMSGPNATFQNYNTSQSHNKNMVHFSTFRIFKVRIDIKPSLSLSTTPTELLMKNFKVLAH